MKPVSKKLLLGALALSATLCIIAITTTQFPACSKQDTPYTFFAPDVIPGKIVTLKKLHEEHFIDYHNMFSSVVREAYKSPKHITLDYTIRILRYTMDLANKGDTLYYVIFDNKDNKLIGSIEIREKNDVDPGQLGCWINENYWGGGRIQEAYKLIADAYFKLKPHESSFEAQVYHWNIRSLKAMQKAGFVFIKTLPPTASMEERHVLEYYRTPRNK